MIGRLSTGGVVRAILAAQIAIAALLFARDLSGAAWPRIELGPSAPRLDQPVAPGDQTRRYRLPTEPMAPGGTPIPTRSDMPDRLTVTPAGEGTLMLAGQIAPGDGERVIAAVQRAGPATVLLNSPGGSVADALALGRALRAGDIAARVGPGDVCLSACPYILGGGTERQADAGARVEVHQHFFGQSTVLPAFLAVEDIQRGQGEVMAYLDEMGIDTRLMRHALVTPPDEIYLLLPDEMARYRLTTDPDG